MCIQHVWTFFVNKKVNSYTLAWNKLKYCRRDCALNFVSVFCHFSGFHYVQYIFPPSGGFLLHSASACQFASSLFLPLFCLSLLFICLHNSFSPFHTFFPLTSFHLSLSQGLSQCHMMNGTTILRPGYVMQWLSSPQRPPPWCWTEGHIPYWSQAVSGHLTKRAPTLATPRKYWGELWGKCWEDEWSCAKGLDKHILVM